MKNINLYRKRFIPDECVLLKNDEIVFIDDEIIVTKWETLKPRSDFNSGNSIYFIKEGYKISQMFLNKKRVYIYCDIINMVVKNDDYICEDLLVDVIVENNGDVKVLDLEEIAQCLKNNVIDKDIAIKSLERISKLLEKIYAGEMETFIKTLEKKIFVAEQQKP